MRDIRSKYYRLLDHRPDSVHSDETTAFEPGDHAWFEYHCYEGHDSADADLWYRSHQMVTIVRQLSSDEADVGDVGQMYRVRFKDGFEKDVFEDELMASSEEFYRPDPPKRPTIVQEAARLGT